MQNIDRDSHYTAQDSFLKALSLDEKEPDDSSMNALGRTGPTTLRSLRWYI